MRRIPAKAQVLLVLTVVAIAGVSGAATMNKLYLNGKVASTSLKVIGGRSYVPVADVAKALGAPITKRGDGYEIVLPGGAYQVEGVAQGKIGDELFSGKWRFQVVSVQDVGPEYKERYYQELRTILAQGAGDTLIVINCRTKNGLTKSQTPMLTERQPGNTALADDQGHSYPPLDYDARQETDKIQSYAAPALLPGAGVEFALVFSVPQGTNAKALVYSAQTYTDDVGRKEHDDLRVTLTQ